jgi:hypothetical protein
MKQGEDQLILRRHEMLKVILMFVAGVYLLTSSAIDSRGQSSPRQRVWLIDKTMNNDEFASTFKRTFQNSRFGRDLKVVQSWDQVTQIDSLDLYVEISTKTRNHFNSLLPGGLTNSWVVTVLVGSFDRNGRPVYLNLWNHVLLYWDFGEKASLGYNTSNGVLELINEAYQR